MVPPTEWRMTARGAHAVRTDRSNRYAFVPHVANRGGLRGNAVYQFRFDDRFGKLEENEAAPLSRPPTYEGPRHLEWHPKLDDVLHVVKL